MSSKHVLPIVTLMLMSSVVVAQEDGDPITIAIGHYRKIASTVLGEDRLLQIRLPHDYEQSEKTYPVLFRLDGEFVFPGTVQTVEQVVVCEQTPGAADMIVVGIPNPTGETRGRDMLPPQSQYAPAGADPNRFLEFIKAELIPFVDANYRTTQTRLLVGQSTSGFFAWWGLLKEPRLFKAVVAISPSFADCRPYMMDEVAAHAQDGALNGAYLYLARGGQGREQGVAESFAMLLPLLESARGLTIRTRAYEELGHVPCPALGDALKTMGTELSLTGSMRR